MNWTHIGLGLIGGLIIGYINGYFRGLKDATEEYNEELQHIRVTHDDITDSNSDDTFTWDGGHR